MLNRLVFRERAPYVLYRAVNIIRRLIVTTKPLANLQPESLKPAECPGEQYVHKQQSS